jgi:hypothetical protein
MTKNELIEDADAQALLAEFYAEQAADATSPLQKTYYLNEMAAHLRKEAEFRAQAAALDV